MNNPLDLSGRTAVITGSGRNIGRCCALEFAGLGANVVLNGRSDKQALESVRAEVEALGSNAIIVVGDVTKKETVERLRDETVKAFGHADIYVSNAAKRFHKDFFETTDEDWHFYLNQQLTTSWYLAKAFVPGMMEKRWGRIIHVNGPDGWFGGWLRIPHSVAKGGLRTLTKSLASGLGEYGITVNDIIPGHTATERDLTTHPYWDAQHVAERAKKVPIRRMTKPEELAWAAAFLCSDRSSAITGHALHVDGGGYLLG